ncbi:Eukaryotic translation initiation factor 4E-3 [Globodera pallida]|nr:Eukaryotic translation initiation factor 4E-3 [Globodera pallida]
MTSETVSSDTSAMADKENAKTDTTTDPSSSENSASTEADNHQLQKAETTVPHDLIERHLLQNQWALWYLKGDRNKNWTDCLKKVSVFDTVEDFWALYNHIQPASGLSWNSDYYLFKEGIKPMWEDKGNLKGGRWLVQVDRQKRQTKLDIYWQEMMMCVIGEQFENLGDHICGAVVNIRQKGDKVSLWTRDANDDSANLQIGHILKAKLSIPDTEVLRYEVHEEYSIRTGSAVKSKLNIPAREKEQQQQEVEKRKQHERSFSQSK